MRVAADNNLVSPISLLINGSKTFELLFGDVVGVFHLDGCIVQYEVNFALVRGTPKI